MKTKALIVNLIALTAIFSTNSAFANTKRGLAFNFKAPVSGVPSYTIGGAVRGDYCAVDRNNSQNMLAYVADKAMTTQSHPSVVVQLPELNSDKTAYLVIKDATEASLFSAHFSSKFLPSLLDFPYKLSLSS